MKLTILVMCSGIILSCLCPGISAGDIAPDNTNFSLPVDMAITSLSGGFKHKPERIKISVTPRENVHVKISCIFPGNVILVENGKGMLATTRLRNARIFKNRPAYLREVKLWVGELPKDATKEFLIDVIAKSTNSKIIVRAEGLMQRGFQEQEFEPGEKRHVP